MKKIICIAAALALVAFGAYAAGRYTGRQEARKLEVFCGADWIMYRTPETVVNHWGDEIPAGTDLFMLDAQEHADGTVFIIMDGERIDLPLYVW